MCLPTFETSSNIMTESASKSGPKISDKKNDQEQYTREIFKCDICDFKAPYDYYGTKPPFCRSLK